MTGLLQCARTCGNIWAKPQVLFAPVGHLLDVLSARRFLRRAGVAARISSGGGLRSYASYDYLAIYPGFGSRHHIGK